MPPYAPNGFLHMHKHLLHEYSLNRGKLQHEIMPQDTEGCAEFEQEPILSSFSDHGDLKELERDRTISPLPQDTEDTVALFKEFDRDKTKSPLPQDTEDTVALFKEFD